jgi:hypothetical protein
MNKRWKPDIEDLIAIAFVAAFLVFMAEIFVLSHIVIERTWNTLKNL